jgi:hypothetical protein
MRTNRDWEEEMNFTEYYTAAHEDSAMEKGFETPFTAKDLPRAVVKKGVSNPFSSLH